MSLFQDVLKPAYMNHVKATMLGGHTVEIDAEVGNQTVTLEVGYDVDPADDSYLNPKPAEILVNSVHWQGNALPLAMFDQEWLKQQVLDAITD